MGGAVLQREETIEVTDGYREVGQFPLEPFALYRLSFEVRCGSRGYWVVDFFNHRGEQNYADHYSGTDPAPDWRPWESVFTARTEAVTGRLGLRRLDAPLAGRRFCLERISRDQALAWMDAVYAALPPVTAAPPSDRWQHLSGTRDRLGRGETLRLVALGDSVSNDNYNGLGHLLVERLYPGAAIQVIHANGPEKSCAGYQRDEILQRLAIRHRPHLLSIGGMSQHGDPEPVRTVIRKVRAACGDVEVVYLDVCTSGDRHPDARREFHRTLGEWAAADRFAVYDMTTRLEQYFAAAGRPREWFLRDTHHVNDRGRQVLARLWAAFFAPDGAGAPG